MWETVRDLTLKSTAPTLVYEEGSLVKRSIRDLYNKEIDEILVAGDGAYTEAKDFMRMLMPSHAKNVKGYRDTLPIFTRHGIESQLDAMFTPVMQLRSGGYIVLNQAEALVAIDVNSGRATREHHIEDTALKTNLEAAEEIARQLRLRDLAGLIVIDFIDMDEKRNNRAVERRLKECLRHDRARIQVGHISHFGLLEMSRQRIRSSVLESSTEKCPHCGGTGHVRSVSSVALQLLRSLDEMLLKGATHNLIVRTRTEIALYLLNQKRAHLRSLEERFRIVIMVNADTTIGGQLSFVIEKGEQVHSPEQAKALAAQSVHLAPLEEEEEDDYEDDEEELESEGSESATSQSYGSEDDESRDVAADASDETRSEGEHDHGRKRRRRRRGRGGGEGREGSRQDRDGPASPRDRDIAAAPGEQGESQSDEAQAADAGGGPETAGEPNGESERRRRRRGRRGGRRNRRDREGEGSAAENGGMIEPELTHAVADLDHEPQPEASVVHVPITESPSDMRTAAHAESREERPVQVDAPQVDTPPAPTPSEPPRRRSTVREPAPTVLGGEATGVSPPAPPPAEPVVSSPAESETGDQPRRSGWWSKRALGKG
jgi:ribonuclease E